MQLKVVGYVGITIYFPCSIDPTKSKCVLDRPLGSVKLVRLSIRVYVDRTPWDLLADAGSKPWLVAQAMDGETADLDSGSAALYRSMAQISRKAAPEDEEDEFLIRAPGDKPPLQSKTPVDLEEDDEPLAEDLFHKKDPMSQYLLQQRKDEAKEKQNRHEK